MRQEPATNGPNKHGREDYTCLTEDQWDVKNGNMMGCIANNGVCQEVGYSMVFPQLTVW